MRYALALSERGVGRVFPNPAVGCVLVKHDQIIGVGWTGDGGRPHAETIALDAAGDASKGATAYVSLEPCAHYGETGPCAEALVIAGVARVVYALKDPDPRVSGGGAQIMENAGIQVVSDVLADEARALNQGFLTVLSDQRPMIALKAAMTLDAKIATKTGESKWITGQEARNYGHHLRAIHDGILVGVETVLADDPVLDCRIAGLESWSPVPIILDSTLRTPFESKLVQGAGRSGLVIVVGPEVAKNQMERFKSQGVSFMQLSARHDCVQAAKQLASRGLTRILVEGGPSVHAAFLKAGIADRLYVFTAPNVMGGAGKPAFADFGVEKLEHLARFRHTHSKRLGSDGLSIFERD